MRHLLAALLILLAPMAQSEAPMTDDFTAQPETRWRFFTDGVMGGVSEGQVAFLTEAGVPFARMTGQVSTANRGGFIQMRRDLPEAAPETATGIRLVARGNDQRYFVHLRTRGSRLPWQYYQAGFEVAGDWAEIRLPFADFVPSGRMLRALPRPESLTSIAIAAFGRDHAARVDIREIGVY
ncbi:putative NADH:ubiquinone oxidoreductase complex I intermediate-associated protein 30 (plasmid) [Dinoroseobacter shibae DFL 12 = DSM 16493]|jgi:hypothetical protein|uniref:Putative NADH:ubiquinone oxidoreductase complex I intermediate-associated protein 30 n=1 Tax=Dinoroseobacter shibae (strain DSM 16493 / NCIMB 14021 / DFL 12) TaxID=398580 RepID=A8LTG1_DINSH|nr:CIA30 family protein [Dinoroseobacter shibae]ABV95528.1 putative NADH:ubiquinone oxidoreductase complex I intermediate-associated protein 30 [Dinoroseobacter shibae DFL 12 = DSM 16493]URF48870.1 CIA30 family protein [Dinoroseobacter shibae]URF53182.1 CIA30 family protein [Dinoroseobacter shibae]